jgi:hypothetical protein
MKPSREKIIAHRNNAWMSFFCAYCAGPEVPAEGILTKILHHGT